MPRRRFVLETSAIVGLLLVVSAVWAQSDRSIYLPMVIGSQPTVAPTPTIEPTIAPTQTPLSSKLVKNGNFEQGHVVWTEEPGQIIITQSVPIHPHSGTWVAMLGGPNVNESLSQSVAVPNRSSVQLQFYYQLESEASEVRDTADVVVNGGVVDSIDLVSFRNTNGDWKLRTVDVSVYAGQSVQLGFSVSTTEPSMIYIDDVAFSS